MDIKIRNIKFHKGDNGEGFYIGRPSPLGNPFKVSDALSREEAIQKYEEWITEKILQDDKEVIEYLSILFANLIRYQQITLLCWCSPKPCHGDIIKKLLLHKYHYGEYITKGEEL